MSAARDVAREPAPRAPHGARLARMRRTPTAPLAAATLIAGYAVAIGTGSRPVGGVVLAAGGAWCIREWMRRNDQRTAVELGLVGFAAFVLSHVLARAIGGWPAVLTVAAATALAVWLRADARAPAVEARA
ncbi:MAG: hypothetical protein QOF54_224 [Solirubrobacteraceae bacterium]|nr:hypothetical protein [Solirubrobacteraceae bacterium]